MNGWLCVGTLCEREIVRFYRDRARLIGALTPPIVFWFLIGSGLGSSFQVPGPLGNLTFLQYFYAGTLELIVLFTSVFSTISIIEDRREGFLQSVLIAPVPRIAIVLGKVLGAAIVGLLQGVTFLIFARAAGIDVPAANYALALLGLTLSSIGLTSLGFIIAWKLNSTQGFHAVMNLFLIPMWMLSGALFPSSSAAGWLQTVIALNPVSYGVSALQHALLPQYAMAAGSAPLSTSLAALAAFAVVSLAACVVVASRRDSR